MTSLCFEVVLLGMRETSRSVMTINGSVNKVKSLMCCDPRLCSVSYFKSGRNIQCPKSEISQGLPNKFVQV